MIDLNTWVCPVCHGGLAKDVDSLRCGNEGRAFPFRDGLPVLMAPEEVGLLDEAGAYARAWIQTGWAPPKGSLADLPHVAGPMWAQKARSLDRLLEILGPPQNRRVADLGAGTGWLSARLAEAGFRCYATDTSADSRVGLGAARALGARGRFEAALATLNRWPFRDGSLDVAICNASLHYLADMRPALDEAVRTLRSDGTFVVMNSPVHRDARSAGRAAREFRDRLEGLGAGPTVRGYRHFASADLERALHGRFAKIQRHDPDYGIRFRLTRSAKARLLRMELASFPIYVSSRALAGPTR